MFLGHRLAGDHLCGRGLHRDVVADWMFSCFSVTDWLVITRVLACVGVVFIVMWLMIGCQCQCLRSRQQHHKWMIRLEELFAIASGLSASGVVGGVVVVVVVGCCFLVCFGGVTLLSQWEFFSWEIRIVFRKESRLRQSRATQPSLITRLTRHPSAKLRQKSWERRRRRRMTRLAYAAFVCDHTTSCEAYSFTTDDL